jgi:valyl-tRNA synthetase
MLFQDFPEGIRPQGADALRITLAVYAAQGRDIKLDVKRVEGYRAFMNKLWNATKFALMHLKEHPVAALDVTTARLTPADRWILGRLQRTIEETTQALDAFRINDAAQALYNFIWKELCDWYIELSKPVLYGRDEAATLDGDAASTRAVLAHVLEQTLRLLHPICPFITEELWHHLPRTGVEAPSLCVAPWPQADPALRFEQEAADLNLAIELISAIRTIRGETNVKPNVQIPQAILLCDDADTRAQIERTRTYLLTQARLDDLRLETTAERPAQTATTVFQGVEIHIPLQGLIDLDEETARLRKEIARMEKEIAFFAKKLGNPGFVAKAPPEVIEKDRAKLAEFEARKAALEASLAALTPPGA